MRIDELIVVEGKDDIAAVKGAVEAQVVSTGGFGFTRGLIEVLKAAVERTGVIIFTDPDSAGNLIRRRLDKLVPGCRHAYLPQLEGVKGKNIGIENAEPASIRQALNLARISESRPRSNFCLRDLLALGLAGSPGAQAKRGLVGNSLGIGDTNTKQFLHRLNHQGITAQELLEAIQRVGG